MTIEENGVPSREFIESVAKTLTPNPTQAYIDGIATIIAQDMKKERKMRALSEDEVKTLAEQLSEQQCDYRSLTKTEYRALMISRGKGEDWW